MNIILFNNNELSNSKVTITDHRHKHIYKILKAKTADKIRIGIINGCIGSGTILSISKKATVLSINAANPPPPLPSIHLVLALPRPIMLKRVLAQAAAIGVKRIDLINANRVEKSFFNAKVVKEQLFLPFLINGLEQAVDTRIPEVQIHERFRPFVEDILPGISPGDQGLIAHPEASLPLAKLSLNSQNNIKLAIGPEGGWVDFEITKFQETGFTAFSLGPRILRVDTAVPAIMSQVNLLTQINPNN